MRAEGRAVRSMRPRGSVPRCPDGAPPGAENFRERPYVRLNVDTAIALADRVVILDQGATVFEGTPAQLTSDEQIAIRYLGVGAS